MGHLHLYYSELLHLPRASSLCDQVIDTKLVLVHNSCHMKISDFWQYYFDHHGQIKWATKNLQPCGERRYYQLSPDTVHATKNDPIHKIQSDTKIAIIQSFFIKSR